jgi:RimJ/RimL family protein N-acetyltransferase
VADWVAKRIKHETGFGECQAMGIEHQGKLVAGLVFHNWEPEAGLIEISAAAKNRGWMTREIINAAMKYAFDVAGSQMVVARIEKTNAPAVRIWRALGSVEHVISRFYGRNRDGCLFTLTDDAWAKSKLNEVNYGQKI